MIHAVILAGGGGTRLWPLSRTAHPKQFLPVFGNHSLLQQTILRFGDMVAPARQWIVTTREQDLLVREQLTALNGSGSSAQVLLEPVGRGTAAAIGLAALRLVRQDPEAVMIVAPADHWIGQEARFSATLRYAVSLAPAQVLVTLGIVPDRPETGYGYIRRGNPLPHTSSFPADSAYQVAQFVEKPDASRARQYVETGAWYWNAGIFVWRAATILDEIVAYMPALAQALEQIARMTDSSPDQEQLAAIYARLATLSIDTGVLEKSTRTVVVPADMDWSDLGDWRAIHRLSAHDARGNVMSQQVLDIDSENSLIHSSHRPVATIGLKNMVVVDTDDALLVCPQDRVQEVRTVVQRLQERHVPAVHSPRTVHRPWGTYTIIDQGPGFQVKRLVLQAGAAFSLQLHTHRSEHWVVTAGIGTFTLGDAHGQLRPGQSIFIPQRTKHRLLNAGQEPLELIEVQIGVYLQEDDIVRFEDLYGRV